MKFETEVQCLHPNGHAASGEALTLSFDTAAESSTLTIGRHDRAIHVSLPMLLRELATLQLAIDAARAQKKIVHIGGGE